MSLKDKKWIVYKHTSPSNKVYIGITSMGPKQRWANGLGYRTQTVMWRAIQKYGWDNFKHDILESDLSYDEAIEKEKYYIEKFKSNCKKYNKPSMGYNMDDGGNTGHSNPISDETKKKISNSAYHLAKRKIIDCYDIYGILVKEYPDLPAILEDFPNIERTNIVKNCKGVISSLNGFRFFYHDDTKGQEQIEPYYCLLERKEKNERQVSQYTLDGQYVATFNTVLEAAKSVNTDSTTIRDVCNQETRSYKEYQWVYGSKEENGLLIKPRVYTRVIEKSTDCENIVNQDKDILIESKVSKRYCERVVNDKIVAYQDLKGEHINNLTILRRAETEEDFQYCKNKKPITEYKSVYWVCRCDCGSLVTVSGRNLRSGHTKSCGCKKFKDLTGVVKGNLTIIERLPFKKNRESLWRCICSCGNVVLRPVSYFSETRKEYMCEECAAKLKSQKLIEVAKVKRVQKDLTGLKIGLLTVKYRADDYISPKGHKIAKWFCECECGGTTEVMESILLREKTLSCGCLARNTTGKVRVKEDLTNKQFGRWKVLYQGEDSIQSNGRPQATWVCQCTCEKGTIKTIRQSVLKSGRSKSCGCLNSELSSERMKKYNRVK